MRRQISGVVPGIMKALDIRVYDVWVAAIVFVNVCLRFCAPQAEGVFSL